MKFRHSAQRILFHLLNALILNKMRRQNLTLMQESNGRDRELHSLLLLLYVVENR